eukprot:5236049-Alexandrium_andersonii.AAC.1
MPGAAPQTILRDAGGGCHSSAPAPIPRSRGEFQSAEPARNRATPALNSLPNSQGLRPKRPL